MSGDDIGDLVDSLAKQFAVENLVTLVREYNAIAGHPDTLAELAEIPSWREVFGSVRLVPFEWAGRGVLYAGALVGEVADAEEREK